MGFDLNNFIPKNIKQAAIWFLPGGAGGVYAANANSSNGNAFQNSINGVTISAQQQAMADQQSQIDQFQTDSTFYNREKSQEAAAKSTYLVAGVALVLLMIILIFFAARK